MSQLEDSQLMGVDYLARRDFKSFGYVQLNRHSAGISPELAAGIYESSDVQAVYSMIEAKSTKIVYHADEASEEIIEAISAANLDNTVETDLEESDKKLRRKIGYLDDEMIFNIPTVGVSMDTLDFPEQYLVDGNIDREKLLSGEEVLLLQTEGKSPYSVGDCMPMTDVVIDDSVLEEFDFSHGWVPEGYEPDFYFKYNNGNQADYPGYAFGMRCDYKVTVGGHIKITDPE